MEKETYIKKHVIKEMIDHYDINDNSASEASFEMFCEWRDCYKLTDHEKKYPIDEFDIESQVSMFNNDLSAID